MQLYGFCLSDRMFYKQYASFNVYEGRHEYKRNNVLLKFNKF